MYSLQLGALWTSAQLTPEKLKNSLCQRTVGALTSTQQCQGKECMSYIDQIWVMQKTRSLSHYFSKGVLEFKS